MNEETDFSKFYDLETYIFNYVRKKFIEQGFIDKAFDFFCIVIWKANRAKSNIAKKLKKNHKDMNLDEIVKALTKEIHDALNPKEKLRILLEKEKWDFGLPMASAILAVFYPEEFTVYDVRVCSVLKKFEDLKNKPKDVIDRYFEYVETVKKEVPNVEKLREKDKFLWGKSFYEQLKNDVGRWDRER